MARDAEGLEECLATNRKRLSQITYGTSSAVSSKKKRITTDEEDSSFVEYFEATCREEEDKKHMESVDFNMKNISVSTNTTIIKKKREPLSPIQPNLNDHCG